MAKAVKIPVTVKMRAGWNDQEINAPELARRMQDAGAAALAVHGRTAAQSYTGSSDWSLISRVASGVSIPVFGSGDCIEPSQLVQRLEGGGVAGVLVGRGALRNPWIFEQAAAIARGETPREITMTERGQFLLEYIDLLLQERNAEAEGFRHVAPALPTALCATPERPVAARGHQKWVSQQTARAELLVYQGARQRLAPAHVDQLGPVDPASPRRHLGVLRDVRVFRVIRGVSA